MINQFKKVILWLFGSLDKSDNTSSGRKWAALTAIWTAVYITIKHTDNLNVKALVPDWLVFGAVCLGLITIPELIKFISARFGKSESTTDKKDQEDAS